jgi:hypothetical protein
MVGAMRPFYEIWLHWTVVEKWNVTPWQTQVLMWKAHTTAAALWEKIKDALGTKDYIITEEPRQ